MAVEQEPTNLFQQRLANPEFRLALAKGLERYRGVMLFSEKEEELYKAEFDTTAIIMFGHEKAKPINPKQLIAVSDKDRQLLEHLSEASFDVTCGEYDEAVTHLDSMFFTREETAAGFEGYDQEVIMGGLNFAFYLRGLLTDNEFRQTFGSDSNKLKQQKAVSELISGLLSSNRSLIRRGCTRLAEIYAPFTDYVDFPKRIEAQFKVAQSA